MKIASRLISFGTVFGFLLTAGLLRAGTIRGTVEARPPEGAAGSGDSAGGGYGSRKFKFLEKIDYEGLKDFVVYIERVKQPADASSHLKASIVQKDGDFSPHVLPVVVGTEVEFTNFDEIFHNVFSMSEVCEFDLGMYKKGDAKKTMTFALPGRVDVFCSIHTKMSCIVLVLPNPWYSRTDDKGRFVIKDVPPGKYRLKAWHERVPAQVQQIEVSEAGETEAKFVLGVGQSGKS